MSAVAPITRPDCLSLQAASPDAAAAADSGSTAQAGGSAQESDDSQPVSSGEGEQAEARETSGAEPDRGPIRVLIAEDEALIRMDLREMLREEGFDVVAEVSDGGTAVRLARELAPDLAILDLKMPVMDGIEAAEQITAERLSAVLILTAFSQRDLIEKARRAGAMAYLVKPFQKHDLLPAIEIAAERFRELQGLETQVGALNDQLEARKAVERAKGLLQKHEDMTEPDAFRWLQRTSMERRLPLKAVAEQVIAQLDTD